eukprot:sb/3477718/
MKPGITRETFRNVIQIICVERRQMNLNRQFRNDRTLMISWLPNVPALTQGINWEERERANRNSSGSSIGSTTREICLRCDIQMSRTRNAIAMPPQSSRDYRNLFHL